MNGCSFFSTAMTDGLPGPNDLAFFALTSKIEGVVRDSVALHIHRKYPALVATREFRRCDLAVFDPQDNEGSNASTATALFSIEFKADGSGKFRTPEGSTKVGGGPGAAYGLSGPYDMKAWSCAG